MNTGVHDASMKQDTIKKTKSYSRNLHKYFQLILEVFDKEQVVWLTTTGVRRAKQPQEWRNILTNGVIEKFNNISIDLAAKHGIQVFDLFGLSRQPLFYELNTDGVHYGSHTQAYYVEVARNIFTHCMQRHRHLREVLNHSEEIRSMLYSISLTCKSCYHLE